MVDDKCDGKDSYKKNKAKDPWDDYKTCDTQRASQGSGYKIKGENNYWKPRKKTTERVPNNNNNNNNLYSCPEMFTIDKYIQRENLTIKEIEREIKK